MNVTRYVGLVLALFVQSLSYAQSRTSSFGLGINSVYYHNADSELPQMPLSPYLDLRVNRHEFLSGCDIYLYTPSSNFVLGAQAAYRYHFLQPHKRNNLFIEFNSQYIQFQKNCSNIVSYYDQNYEPCTDGVVYRYRSAVSTLGLGAELFLCKRFSFYSIISGGINFMEARVVKNFGEFASRDQNILSPVAALKLGLSYNIFVKRKNACDSCPH